MPTAKVALRPKNEAPRQSARTERGTTIFNSSNVFEYNQRTFQAQRLMELYGLRPERAQLIAALFFGGCHG
jgi:hypothetical protein